MNGDDKNNDDNADRDTGMKRSTFSASCARWEVQPLLDVCHLDDVAASAAAAANNNNNNNNGTVAIAAVSCGRGYHELAFRCQRYDGVRIKYSSFICIVSLDYYFLELRNAQQKILLCYIRLETWI